MAYGDSFCRLPDARPCTRNAPGWHWVEKDCLEWSRSRLSELLGGLTLADSDGVRVVSAPTLQSLTGEAFVNQRKGKLIPSYELELKLAWQGSDASGAAAQGLLHLPYLAEENAGEPDALEVRVSAQGDTQAHRDCKAALLKHALVAVRAAVATWVTEMQAGGPGGAGPQSAPPAQPAGKAPPAAKTAPVKAIGSREESVGGVSTIRLEERFYCRPVDIFEALTNPSRVRAFTQSEAQVSAACGAPFQLFGGNVVGENLEMEPGRLIVQNWRFKNWAEGVFSTVRIELREPEHGTTVLSLTQTGVPLADCFGNESVHDTTKAGWTQNFFERIRKVFGYGC